MAIPDWVTQSIQEDEPPLMSAMRNASYGEPVPAPLPQAAAWAPPPQTAEQAVLEAGYSLPEQPQAFAQQAPMQVAPVAEPVAPMSTDPAQNMSVAPQAPVSELNYSPMPPEAPPQEAPQQYALRDPTEDVTNALMRGYMTSRAYPEAVLKAAETWQQAVPSAMPGQEGPYAAAKQALTEAEDRAAFNQQASLAERADIEDQNARNAFMQGRGFASEAAAIQADQDERKAVIDSRVAELDKLIDQRSHMAESFAQRNPVRDMSMWTRIAIGIGAAGQALAGGQNAALELAMREIDADMAAERNQIDRLGVDIAAKRTLLGDMLQKFRDPAAADHAARAAKLGLYESSYRAQAAKEKSAELRAAWIASADALGMQRQQEKLASLTGEHQTLMKWRPAGATQGGLPGLQKLAAILGYNPGTPEYREFMNKGISGQLPQYMAAGGYKNGAMSKDELNQARFDQDHKVRMSDGTIGFVKDKTDYEKTITSLNKMDQNLGRLRKYVKSGSAWSPTDRANVEAITNMAMGEIRVMLGLGVMSDSDKRLAEQLTGEFVNDRFSVADKINRLENLLSLTSQTRREYESRVSLDPNANTPAVAPIRSVRAK